MRGFCLPNDFSKATLRLRAKATDNRRGHRHFAASFQSRSSESQKSAFFLHEIPFQFWRHPFKPIWKIDGRTYETLKRNAKHKNCDHFAKICSSNQNDITVSLL